MFVQELVDVQNESFVQQLAACSAIAGKNHRC
jgi:hypothetical protein